MKNYFKILLFICLLASSVYAQNRANPGLQTGDPNDLDEKYIPEKNSILNSANNSKTTSGNSIQPDIKNVFKFNLALLGRSTAAVFWEHPFGKLLSLETGLGVCFAQDYMQKTFSEVSDGFTTNDNSGHLKLHDVLSSSTYASPSPFLSAGLKLYFTDDAPDGSYVNFNLRYSTNNLTYVPNNENGFVAISGSPDVTVKNLGFNFVYGYQLLSGTGKAAFIQDFYAGFGIKHTGFTGFASQNYYNAALGQYQTVYFSDGSTQSVLAPVFLIGYSLGFGL